MAAVPHLKDGYSSGFVATTKGLLSQKNVVRALHPRSLLLFYLAPSLSLSLSLSLVLPLHPKDERRERERKREREREREREKWINIVGLSSIWTARAQPFALSAVLEYFSFFLVSLCNLYIHIITYNLEIFHLKWSFISIQTKLINIS